MVYVGIFLFHGNMLAPYRKIEMLELLMFSFRIVQNFRPNSRPLNSGLEKNALHIWIQNDLSFSKLFEIWKSNKKWQLNNPNLCIGLHMCKYVSSMYIMVYVQRENAKKMSHLKTFLTRPADSSFCLKKRMRKLWWRHF